MEIHQVNNEVMEVLYGMVKGLARQIKIYKGTMHEDKDSVPNSYILLKSEITDSASNYGDGLGVLRNADCDIVLVTKGYATKTTDTHNVNKRKIRDHLLSQGIEFIGNDLGYDTTLESTQYTFSVGVKYGFKPQD